MIKDNLFDIPPLFRIIKEQSGTNWPEMYRVFNMGHRFELYVPGEMADDIIKISGNFGVEARIIGYCQASERKQLTVRTSQGEFNYY